MKSLICKGLMRFDGCRGGQRTSFLLNWSDANCWQAVYCSSNTKCICGGSILENSASFGDGCSTTLCIFIMYIFTMLPKTQNFTMFNLLSVPYHTISNTLPIYSFPPSLQMIRQPKKATAHCDLNHDPSDSKPLSYIPNLNSRTNPTLETFDNGSTP